MKTFSAICLALLAGGLSASAQGQEKKIEVIVENPWNAEKVDEPVVIDLSSLGAGFTVKSATVFDGTNEIPSQLDDMNGDTRADELAFVINLPASGKKTLNVTLSSLKSDKTYPARVYAEMLFRTSKKNKYAKGYAIYADGASDTYNVQHHHGAAFESELVAYRIYFNEKQTTDLYGKFHKGLELEESQFYPTDEQLKRGFGDDVIKVNSSCGAGTLRGWDGTQSTLIKPVAVRGQRILASGPVRTIVDAEVKGWQYQNKELNMINRYILYAGHRDAQVDVLFDAPLDKEVFCTGVQNITGHADMFSDHNGLVASWGTDWPVNDTVKYKKETVGLATYIPKKYVVKETSDKENFLYTISAPGKSSFRYYTSFTSCKETFGYPDKEKWFAYVQEWKKALEQPVKITVVKK
jgi:energy-coupling factor transporter ATP-binding protein EcfA2